MEVIFNRRSIRKYEDKPVEREKIEKLLRAAMQAPSAGNQQPWEFIIVEDKERLKKLSEASPYSKMVANSPVTVVLLSREEGVKFPPCIPQDMGSCCRKSSFRSCRVRTRSSLAWNCTCPRKNELYKGHVWFARRH